VSADGKSLPAGTYQVRLTAEPAKPDAVGTTQELARWAEFVQGGTVRGREVVNIVPQAEIKMVVKDAPPPSGGSKVQVLRGNEYLRVWINRGGNHYLMHFPIGGGAPPRRQAARPPGPPASPVQRVRRASLPGVAAAPRLAVPLSSHTAITSNCS
jgi:hypothetical protein